MLNKMIILSSISIKVLLPLMILIGIIALIPLIKSLLKIKRTILFSLEFLIGLILSMIPYFQKVFINSFSEGLYIISLAFFLFLSGLDIDFSVFKHKEKEPSILRWSLKLLLIIYLLGFGISFFFKNEILHNFWYGIILITIFFTSTFASIVIPVVHHKKGASSITIGKILCTYASFAELLSIIFLSIMMIVMKSNQNAKPWLLGVIVVNLFILILLKKLNKLNQISFFIALFLLLLFIILSEQAGVELILGAFLLGAVLKWCGLNQNTFKTIEHLGYDFLIPIFFIIVGFKIPLMDLNRQIIIFTLIILFALLIVKAPFLLLFKYDKSRNILPIYLLSTSTLIVALGIDHFNLLTFDLSKAMIIASSITILFSPLLFEILFVPPNNDNITKIMH